METWGELFWDAWIRLRLSCRRLYRTYWPPQFKAWQVCTVTGIVSIILTLVVLNLPSGKTELQAKNGEPVSVGKNKKPTKGATKAHLTASTADPFAEVETTNPATELIDESTPPAQVEPLESPIRISKSKRLPREEVALNDEPALDITDSTEAKLTPPLDEPRESTIAPLVTEAATAADEPFVEPAAQAPVNSRSVPEAESSLSDVEQPVIEPALKITEKIPASEPQDRDPNHYLRGHHEDH